MPTANDLKKPYLTTARHLRIFISSTFCDMQKEREILVKHIFPEIKKIARERFVEISKVDLRWGVTPEQSESGQALKICLGEIKKCKESPVFFIGILGERYGWVPTRTDMEIFDDEQYRWLKNNTDRSVTELEILYGVLNYPSQNQVSYFYFRDPALSREIETQFTQDSIETQKQQALKTTIQNTKKVSIDGYQTIEEFGERVLEDMRAELDRLFPLEDAPTLLEQERISHAQFAASRKTIYIPDEIVDGEFDAFVQSATPYLMLYADSGMGKSALIAHMVERYSAKNPDAFVIEHYIGGGGGNSSSLPSLLLRIMSELKEKYEITDELPSFDKLEDEFVLWFYKIPNDAIVTIFIDALNQLDERSNYRWIPQTLPANVKIVLSSIEDINIIAEVKNITLSPLSTQKQNGIFEAYLTKFGKNFTDKQIDKMVSSEATKNPLYFKVLLDELRVFGSYDNLDSELDELLSKREIDDLFEKVLSRLENDYDKDGILKEILSLIWCSKEGMNEDELLEIINGIDIEEYQERVSELRVTKMELSHILLSLDEHLIDKEGKLNFFHTYLAKAIQDRYLQDALEINAYRICIADYFQHGLDLGNKSIDRIAIELPYQYHLLRDEKHLLDTIGDFRVFNYKDNVNWEIEIHGYYLSIKNILEKEDIFYQKLFTQINQNNELQFFYLFSFSVYCKKYISIEKAKRTAKRTIKIGLEWFGNKNANTLDALMLLGSLYYLEEKNIQAEKIFNFVIKTIIESGQFSQKEYFGIFYSALDNLGLIAQRQSDYKKAFKHHQLTVGIFESFFGSSDNHTLIAMNNLAMSHQNIGEYPEAETLFLKVLKSRLEKFESEHIDVLHSKTALALLYLDQKNYKRCLELLKEVFAIMIKKLGLHHDETLNTAGSLCKLYTESKDNSVLEYLKTIYSQETDRVSFVNIFGSIAMLYFDQKEYKKGQKLLIIALTENRKQVDVYTINNMNMLGANSQSDGDYDKALCLYFATIKTQQELGIYDRDSLETMDNIAEIYSLKGKINKVRIQLEKTLNLKLTVLGEKNPDTLMTIINLAMIYHEIPEKYNDAFQMMQYAFQIAQKELGDSDVITLNSMNYLGLFYYKDNKKEFSYGLFKEAYELGRIAFGEDNESVQQFKSNYYRIKQELENDYILF